MSNFPVSFSFTDKQVKEIGKLLLDLGKLIFGSMVLGFFQSGLDPLIVLAYELTGLLFSMIFFIFGIMLLKEID